MSAKRSEQWLTDYRAKRGLRIEIVDEGPKVKIDREVKHDYKAEFEQQLSLVGIQVEREFRFAAPRRWRSDWMVVGTTLLIEFEGGLFKKRAAGHSSVSGILRDVEKYNAAAIAGWTVIRITPKHVVSGEALAWVIDAIENLTTKSPLK